MTKEVINVGVTPNDGSGDTLRDAFIKVNNNFDETYYNNRVTVTQENLNDTLGGVIDPTVQYFLDGVIDMGSTSIEVPADGIYISGYNFDISGLTSSEEIYYLETSLYLFLVRGQKFMIL